jgi:hypothetical protein
VKIVWRHRSPCLTFASQEGSISHHVISLRVPVQSNGARGKPLVRATGRIGAPFTEPSWFAARLSRRALCTKRSCAGEPVEDLLDARPHALPGARLRRGGLVGLRARGRG